MGVVVVCQINDLKEGAFHGHCTGCGEGGAVVAE